MGQTTETENPAGIRKARAGDFLVFDFSHSHMGLVVEEQASIKSIMTIEGNTNGKGDRDSDCGDGVWKKQRMPKLTNSHIRLFP